MSVRFSESLDADPASLLASACKMNMEGIVGKRAGSAYKGDRDGTWVKLKCFNRQEFVVVGYTRAAAGIGSLLLGLHDDEARMVYAGRVQSGLSGQIIETLRTKLQPIVRETTALAITPRLGSYTVIWVDPVIVCEVRFAELTPSGKVRHAVFMGLREDKPADGISFESNNDIP